MDTTEDDLDEPDEGFTVTLTVPDGVTVPAGVTVQATAATGTIRDDDVLSAAVSREAATVVEGQWAEFPVTVSDGTSTAEVVVAYAVGGTATAGTDYTAPSGELTITSGHERHDQDRDAGRRSAGPWRDAGGESDRSEHGDSDGDGG